MGKNDGFMIYGRENNKARSAAERIKDFGEFKRALDKDERRRQAARCMDCGVPMCQSAIRLNGMVTGCPLHNLIPEWNDALYGGYYETALSRLLSTSNFPEFTGRVCPALCEKACNLGYLSQSCCCNQTNGTESRNAGSTQTRGGGEEAVSIHDNELFIIEKAFQDGVMRPRIPKVRTDKKVAVIGSGPAGLAVADMLNRRGHNVVIFEREDAPGGLLMYGIPNMKLDKSIVRRRIELMKAEGVEFRCSINVGKDDDVANILKEYDATALCCGAKRARTLDVPGSDAAGVTLAVDFLTAVTKSITTEGIDTGAVDTFAMSSKRGDGAFVLPSIKGKSVVVVGGGDTGNDCVGTAIRLGACSVSQIEMMPKPPEVRAHSNPWPQWPKVLKTDYGQEEAVALFGKDPRTWSATVKEVRKDESGHIKAVVLADVKMQDVNGERHLVNIEGSEREVPCDLLLIAAGFVGCEEYTAKAFGVELGNRGTAVVAKDSHKTSVDGVFAAGDMVRGQSLVVWAIAEGRECAREIDKYLMGYTNL